MNTNIPTVLLQDLVAKAVKASTFVKQLPLTSLMEIKVENNNIYVSATDSINVLQVNAECVADDFKVVVDSRLFSATVAKLSKERTILSIEGNKLTVEADGKYNISISSDSDGSAITFPNVVDVQGSDVVAVSNEAIKSVLGLNKTCKAEMKELPAIYNYYADTDKVVTYDFFKICNNPIKISNKPICITPSFMSLIPSVCDDKGVNIVIDGDNILAYSSAGKLSGKTGSQEDLNTFPITELSECVKSSLAHSCMVSNTMLSNAVDRLSLFVDITSNALELTFTNSEIILKSPSTNSEEHINYVKGIEGDLEPVIVLVNSIMLRDILTSCDAEMITINFGTSDSIQIQLGDVTLVLSALG